MDKMDKSAFFAAYQPQSKPHTLPDGQTIDVRGITAAERSEWREASKGKEDHEVRAMLVIKGCKLFSDEDLPQLVGMLPGVLEDISNHILQLSGLVDTARESAKKK